MQKTDITDRTTATEVKEKAALDHEWTKHQVWNNNAS